MQKLYSVALGPLKEGKPDKVEIVLAFNLMQLATYYAESDVLSIQVLPDKPIVI